MPEHPNKNVNNIRVISFLTVFTLYSRIIPSGLLDFLTEAVSAQDSCLIAVVYAIDRDSRLNCPL
jgi:hypothetical protein